jgi:hypothetical protein
MVGSLFLGTFTSNKCRTEIFRAASNFYVFLGPGVPSSDRLSLKTYPDDQIIKTGELKLVVLFTKWQLVSHALKNGFNFMKELISFSFPPQIRGNWK